MAHMLKHSTIRPVTLTQLMTVVNSGEDVPLKLDGADVHRVKFIGMLSDTPPVHTNTCSVYTVQDALSSASIAVLNYNVDDSKDDADDFSHDADKANKASGSPMVIEPNVYYAWFGALLFLKKARGNPQTHVHVHLHCARKLTDMNELTFHGLEALHTHLLFTRK